MPEFFGPYLPQGFFAPGYFGLADSGGATYANGAAHLVGVAVVAGAGIATRREDAADGWSPSRTGRIRLRPRRRVYLDASVVIGGGSVVKAKSSSIAATASNIGGGAKLGAVAKTTRRVPHTQADNAFWLLAA